MKYFFLFLLFLLVPSAGAVAVMPIELDLCKSNKVYVENNLEETAQYIVYNNEERVFSFYLEPGKRRGVYITKKGDASIEETVPESMDVINSVEISVKPCGKDYLSKAVKAAFIGLAFTLVLGIILFYWIANRKNGRPKRE
ncbi:MAG: hypothetical protein KJ955_08880 [Nanoarchaeota archaeon]|nr:hypothetical protein [Nanoarchaeota archaeon]